MSMNKFMHNRNIYKTPPDFKELAINYPEFRKYAQNKLDGGISFDFKNSEALRCLTTLLLKRDFRLDVFIPQDKLVPTLPLRLNYILWLEDVLDWKPENSDVKGIDIGTGASCIFPLLAAKKNNWKMLCTEINDSSVNIAVENVRKNSLENLISIRKVPESTFLDGVLDDQETFDFCMCNPPFFSSEDDLDSNQKSRNANRKEPSNCRTGVADEIISPGGEVEFIRNIICDSLKLRERIKIYTTMMGHKSSLEILIKDLQNYGLTHSQTMFCQGHTVRWALAWTYCPIHLKDYLPQTHKKTKPLTWTLASKYNFQGCVETVPRLLADLKIQCTLVESFKKRSLWKIIAYENTWTGSRRKRREQKRMQATNNSATGVSEETATEVSLNSENPSNDSKMSNTSADDQMDVDDSSTEKKSAMKRPLDEEEETPALKKLKILEKKVEPILEALLSLHSAKNNSVDLQITYINGLTEAPQQLMQYLKNNLI